MPGSNRVDLPDIRKWSGGPPGSLCGPAGYPGVVGRSSRMSGSGWEALPDVQEWSEVPPGCPGVVGRPSRMPGSCRQALPDVCVALPDIR